MTDHSVHDARRRRPLVNCRLDPSWDGHRTHMPALADEVGDDSVPFALLNRLERQREQLGAAQPTADQHGEHGMVAPFTRRRESRVFSTVDRITCLLWHGCATRTRLGRRGMESALPPPVSGSLSYPAIACGELPCGLSASWRTLLIAPLLPLLLPLSRLAFGKGAGLSSMFVEFRDRNDTDWRLAGASAAILSQCDAATLNKLSE
jgi:hypothetical protein